MDGSRTILITEPGHLLFRATGCPFGKYVVFVWQGHSVSSKTNLWRIDADGSNLKQLTQGVADVGPYCSADERWVYYSDLVNARIMRVPSEGGEAEALKAAAIPGALLGTSGMGLSRDGQFLTFTVLKSGANQSQMKVAIVRLNEDTGTPARFIEPDPRIVALPHFTPDGKSIVYIIRGNGAENLWIQPLDGGAGRMLTNFVSDTVQGFDYSPDGKKLAVFRSHVESDVVLLRDVAPSQ